MKAFGLVAAACVAMAIGVVGCEEKKPTTPTSGGTAPKGIGDSIKDAAKNAGETIDKAATQAKDKAVAAAEDLYNSTKSEFDALASKVSSSNSPQKPMWQTAVDSVKSHFNDAEKKLGELKADNSDWQKISGELSSLMTKIKEGIQSLASQVK